MNQVILKGRLTKDVEIKFTQNNKKLAGFSVAVQRGFKNQNGEYESDFFNCTAFGNTAELLEKYFKKGQEILLVGRLQNRSWEAQDGTKRYATDVIVERVEFCGSKKDNEKEPWTPAMNDLQYENSLNNKNDTTGDTLPF